MNTINNRFGNLIAYLSHVKTSLPYLICDERMYRTFNITIETYNAMATLEQELFIETYTRTETPNLMMSTLFETKNNWCSCY